MMSVGELLGVKSGRMPQVVKGGFSLCMIEVAESLERTMRKAEVISQNKDPNGGNTHRKNFSSSVYRSQFRSGSSSYICVAKLPRKGSGSGSAERTQQHRVGIGRNVLFAENVSIVAPFKKEHMTTHRGLWREICVWRGLLDTRAHSGTRCHAIIPHSSRW